MLDFLKNPSIHCVVSKAMVAEQKLKERIKKWLKEI